MKNRNLSIDIAKAISIILIVFSHTNILNNNVNIFVNTFYIAIFFILSGYTYKTKK